MLATADTGEIWSQLNPNLGAFGLGQASEPDPGFNPELSITSVDHSHGCVLTHNGHVVCTSDAWTTTSSSSLPCFSLDIAMIDQNSAVATCFKDGVQVWSTIDAGTSWNRVAEINSAMLTANEIDRATYGSPLVFQDSSTGWLARFNLWGTRDGGTSWQRAADGIHPDLGISLVDVNRQGDGWALTVSGTVLQLQPAHTGEVRRPRTRRTVPKIASATAVGSR